MKINMIGSFQRNHPFGTEIAFAKGLQEIGENVGWIDPSTWDSVNWHDPSVCDALIMFKEHSKEANEMCKVFRDDSRINKTIVIEYQPDDIRAPGIRGMMKRLSDICDYAFTFDVEGARVASEELGYKKARKLLVTADPEIYHPIVDSPKDIDFCFIGSLSNAVMHKSRNRMVKVLRDAGFSVEAISTFDPNVINTMYNRSKFVLNHATDVGQDFGFGYGYQCRHFEVGMTGTPLISNSLLDDEPEGPQNFLRFWDEKSLIVLVEFCLDMYPSLRYPVSPWFDEIMTKHTPECRAKEIVAFIEECRDEA